MHRQISLSLALIFLLVAVSPAFAERVELGGGDDVNIIVEESSDERIVVRFEVNAYYKDAVDISGQTYYSIRCGDEWILLNEGEPALPRISRAIIIADDAEMQINVLSSQYVDFSETDVVPSKGDLMRNVNPDTIPYSFGPVYASSDWYPLELATIRTPHILRDYRGTVIDLNAFQYNPGTSTLRVYTSVQVEVIRVGPGQVNVFTKSRDGMKLVPE